MTGSTLWLSVRKNSSAATIATTCGVSPDSRGARIHVAGRTRPRLARRRAVDASCPQSLDCGGFGGRTTSNSRGDRGAADDSMVRATAVLAISALTALDSDGEEPLPLGISLLARVDACGAQDRTREPAASIAYRR